MKFQKMIRVQMMLVSLGAGLLLARPVRGQQEVDPTFFAAAPGACQVDQAAAGKAAPSLKAANAAKADSAAPLAAQEVDAAQLTSLDAKTIVVLMIGIGSIVLLGMAGAIRGNRRETVGRNTASAFPTGAAARFRVF